MTQKQNALAKSNGNQSHLQQLVVKVCLYRLIVLLFLLLPMVLSWLGDISGSSGYVFNFDLKYTIFLISGFGLTILLLLTWSFFQDIIFFFHLQLVCDLLLITYLVSLTGGIASNFNFLFLAATFLYGKLLGRQSTNIIAILIAGFYLLIALLQNLTPWLEPQISLFQLFYYLSLQLLALGLILMLLKITQGRETELLSHIASQQKELRRSEALKGQVFDWMNSGLLVLDNLGKIKVINKQALAWSKLSHPSEAIGQPLEYLFPEIHQAWENWEHGSDKRVELQVESKKLIFGATLTYIPEEKGSLILFTDITKVKELEERVKHMEKMASIGELAAGLAHEIKNPLSGIKGSMQLILQNQLSREQNQRLQKVIERDIHRLSNLLNDFLIFARPTQAQKQSVNLEEKILNCKQNVSCKYPDSGITVDSSVQGVYWNWDPEQLNQVLLNLLLNAVQAALNSPEPKVKITLKSESLEEKLLIIDNGPGLPEGKSLFDPFVTTKKDGSGLGLSIAQRIAHQNQSWIELQSTQQGTECRLCHQPDTTQGPKQ